MEYEGKKKNEINEKVAMNLCFLMGKVISQVEFNFVLNSNLEIIITSIEFIESKIPLAKFKK